MMTDADLPTPEPTESRREISWVWLMPVLAVLVALGMVWQTYANRGPVIVVTFPSASGIEAEQTPLRYRELDVGTVEEVTFSEGLSAIEVHIRLDQKIAPYVDAGSEFWLVEPQVSARGITGLGTVLSGVYIEGSWDGTPGEAADRFEALTEQPLFSPDQAGTRIVLSSRTGGQLSAGAPVLFNGISVGWIGRPVLSENGLTVTRDAFIEAPYDARLSTASRFWDSSGLSFDIGTNGVSFNMESLAALVEGGVTFGTLVTGGQAIEPGHVFDVFSSLRTARADALEGSGTRLSVAALVDASVAGLSAGTVVRYGRANVGEVTAVTGFRDADAPSGDMQLLVDLEIIPERLGFAAGLTTDEQLATLADRIAAGLRLRLASEGIIGQTTILEFIQAEDAGAETLVIDRTPFPLVPTAPARVGDATEGMEGLVDRVSNLPIEELMTSAIGALESVQQLAGSPDALQLPANANGLISDARGLVGSDEIRIALADFQAATTDLRAMTDEIRNSPGLANLLTALESSQQITDGLAAFSEGLPGVLDSVAVITDEIREVPLAELVGSLDQVTQQLQGFLGSESIDDLPEAIRGTLEELQNALTELRTGGAVENLNKALAAAQGSMEAIEIATELVPEVVSRLDSTARTLETAVSGYAPGSRIQVDITNALRNISEAAAAFRSLSRTLERDPSSLITGR
ncbi:MAG TPA: paraquat-inducible protein B [Rhodobacteraceae bacterium]|nr:paraquat-inducible protein B [Paracoccaceae bacterium]